MRYFRSACTLEHLFVLCVLVGLVWLFYSFSFNSSLLFLRIIFSSFLHLLLVCLWCVCFPSPSTHSLYFPSFLHPSNNKKTQRSFGCCYFRSTSRSGQVNRGGRAPTDKHVAYEKLAVRWGRFCSLSSFYFFLQKHTHTQRKTQSTAVANHYHAGWHPLADRERVANDAQKQKGWCGWRWWGEFKTIIQNKKQCKTKKK